MINIKMICRISTICQRFKKRYKNINHKPISEMDHINIHVGHKICTKVKLVENTNNFSTPNPFKCISDLLLFNLSSTSVASSRHSLLDHWSLAVDHYDHWSLTVYHYDHWSAEVKLCIILFILS